MWCIFFQTKFSEVHKELLAVQSEFEAMKTKLTGLEFQLSESQQISQGQDDTIKSQAKKLREQQDALTSLRSSEEGLRSQGQEMEETVTSLKKELARSQAEYSLLREVINSFLIWTILWVTSEFYEIQRYGLLFVCWKSSRIQSAKIGSSFFSFLFDAM